MKRLPLFVSLIVVLSVILSACGGAAPTEVPAPVVTEAPATEAPAPAPTATEAPVMPVDLKIAYSSTIDTWDPIASFSTEAAYLPNVYETLLKINKPGSAEKYTPVLAESWSVSDDKKAYTFNLRSGVKFHDGEPMNAAAVKATIDAVKDHGGAGFIWWSVESVEVVDDLTVKFNLSTPQPIDLIASESLTSPETVNTGFGGRIQTDLNSFARVANSSSLIEVTSANSLLISYKLTVLPILPSLALIRSAAN